ncbi:hypothetical protein DD237_008075 [Peronospora effusa]|uniref:RxLR effector candidate protein n=1 Tax=Peronospora effusa TaxID=542832 RepID=A0A3R7WLP3_9STRA|nr:hypothetical protein DD237_008075 [Peronospora effusa]
MLVKLIKAPLALLVVMLIALLAVTMAFADEQPLTPQASDMPNVVHTRYLRSTANVTTNQQVDSGERRRLVTSLAGLERLPASLHQSVVKIFAKLRVRWWLWRQHQKTPDDVFKFLQLDKVKGSVFKSPKFSAWKYFVVKTNPTEEDAFRVMFKVIESKFEGEAALVKVLGQAKGSHGDTVQRLRDYQIERWLAEKETVESVFHRLKLKQLPDSETSEFAKQVDSPEFIMWGAFITKTESSYDSAFNFLLRGSKGEFNLIRALAGTTSEDLTLAVGLIYSRLQHLQLADVSPIEICIALWPPKIDHLLVRVSLDYVYMSSMNKSGLISFVRVAQHLHTIFGSFTGTKMMNVLMKDDFAGSARRIKALLEYPVQKKWLKNPLA